MFVTSKKYKKAVKDSLFYKASYEELKALHEVLVSEWNILVDRVNKKGGDAFLRNATLANTEFSAQEIQELISLCHPDKHGGKESAVRLTQKLLKIRSSLDEKD